VCVQVSLRTACCCQKQAFRKYRPCLLCTLSFNLFNLYQGYWFDGSKNVELVTRAEDPDFAPEFVLKHSEKYQNMLTHPENN